MSVTIKTGWLKDNNGEKFAPKTILSQIVDNSGLLSSAIAFITKRNDEQITMPTTINKGWVTDSDGASFAPITLSSQIVKDNGESFENYVDTNLEGINQDVDTLTSNLNGLKFMKVSALPSNPDANTIYFIV